MELNELTSSLRDISNMRSASHFKRTICKMAAQRLEAQQTRITQLEAELKEERRWIPVEERLPEDDPSIKKHHDGEKFGFLTVLAYNGVVRQTNRFFCGEERCGLPKTNGWEWASANVTHWRPLPEPPEEVG